MMLSRWTAATATLTALVVAAGGAGAQNHRARMVDLGGRATEIVEWGTNGPYIVMIHGANMTPHMFDTFAPRFASRYHIVAYARRGHGKATPPATPFGLDDLVEDLRIVMDSIGIARAILMAHSFGGHEITRFAALHPRRVDGLVYLDAQFEMSENPYLMQAMESMPIPPCAENMKSRTDFRACIAGYLMPPIAWSATLDEMLADILADTAGSAVFRTSAEPVGSSMMQAGTQYKREYDRISAPALFLMSDTYMTVATTDTAWNRRLSEWHETGGYVQARQWWIDHIREVMPQARIAVLEGTSHDNFVWFDGTYEEVDRFLSARSR